MSMNEDQEWTTVIKPRNNLFEVNLKEIWSYRDLLALFIKRDIVTQYKQTILGPLWYLIQPAMTTIMYMVVFGGIAKISTDGLPQPLFYLAGICIWQYFADCLNKTSNTFVSNQGIFGKVYFPRLIAPISTVISNSVRLGIQILLFTAVYIYYVAVGVAIAPNIHLLLLPVLLIMIAGLALGFGIIISSLTTKYRDMTILFTFIVNLWMYATPVVYPLSTVTNPLIRKAMVLNPVTAITEAFKFSTMGIGEFSWGMLGYSFVFMVLLLAIGIIIFNRVQKIGRAHV